MSNFKFLFIMNKMWANISDYFLRIKCGHVLILFFDFDFDFVCTRVYCSSTL